MAARCPCSAPPPLVWKSSFPGISLTFRRIRLIHPVLSLDAGSTYLASLDDAARGELDPFLLVVEGSLFDQRLAGEGTFSRLGEQGGRAITVEQWVKRLAPQAAVVLAIGTCAAWGGIPAAKGNVTGAMGLSALLGTSFALMSACRSSTFRGVRPTGMPLSKPSPTSSFTSADSCRSSWTSSLGRAGSTQT